MTRITLPRTAEEPLTIEATLIAQASSRAASGPVSLAWNEIDLYDAGLAGYAVAIRFRSTLRGERAHDHAALAADGEDALLLLRGYDPAAYLTLRDRTREFRVELADAVRSAYARAVDELFQDGELASGIRRPGS